MFDLILKVNGISYAGWTTITVFRSMDNLSGTYSFTASDKFPGKPEDWNLRLGYECTVEVGKSVLITGYIEDIAIDYDANSHSITVSGRDKLGDLVDCTWIDEKNEWKNRSARWIIDDLISPFDILLVVDRKAVNQVDQIIPDFKADEGETVAEMIMRLCRMIAILPITYGNGKLLLTQVGSEYVKDSLELGKNIKAGSLSHSNLDRFSQYVVKGQGNGTDMKALSDFVAPSGTFNDTLIERYRPFTIFSEIPTTIKQCQDRAKWEARIRAGRSRMVEYEVQGITQSNGDMWPINALTHVKDPFMDIDEKMLIHSVENEVSENGSITRLSLINPKAYELISEPLTQIKGGFDPRTHESQPL